MGTQLQNRSPGGVECWKVFRRDTAEGNWKVQVTKGDGGDRKKRKAEKQKQ